MDSRIFNDALDMAQTFMQTAKRPLIFHVSDTETAQYPMLKALLDVIKPELLIHTGDLADEYKVGRRSEDLPAYSKAIPALIDIMEEQTLRVVITAGNNDDLSLIGDREDTFVVPGGTRYAAFGVTLELDHAAIPFTSGVDFALYGHGPSDDLRYPLPDEADAPVYLNGNYFWTIIEPRTKRFLRIPIREADRTMRLFIARHGQVVTKDNNGSVQFPKHDPHLSAIGVRQSRYLAKELIRSGFKGRIISSPFTRALMTAQPIAQAVGRPIEPEADFREVVGAPSWIEGFQGKTADEMRALIPEIAEDACLPDPWWKTDVETMDEVKARVRPLIDRLIEEGEDVLLVGHGASTCAAIEIMMEKCGYAFDSFMPAPVSANCALSEFRFAHGKFRPVRVQSIAHMPLTMVSANASMAVNKEALGNRQ